MQVLHFLTQQAARLWRFLGIFQSPAIRLLHALTAGLVILQIIDSAWTYVGWPGASWMAWVHFWGGMSLCLLALILIPLSLATHGLRHFFPYLWGDLGQLKKDLAKLRTLALVAPRPRGLAAAVQGLGLGALALAAFSGLFWFFLWQSGSPYTWAAKDFHESMATLLAVYLCGHGGMALLHFILWQKKTTKPD